MDEKNVFPLGKMIPSNKKKAGHVPAASAAPQIADSAREFVEAAKTHSVPVSRKAPELDWRSLDPDERPTRGINVRFNEYELALLRHIARREDRSIHQIIKRLLIPAAQQAAED